MQLILKEILTFIIALCMQTGVAGMVSTTPQEAVNGFLDGLAAQEQQVMEKHMDNAYINFLSNVEGDEAVIERMNEALFANFSYEVEEIGEKNDVAVAKVLIKCNDFSSVNAKYDSASYAYVMENLYSDSIADKDALAAACLDIYVQQIEAASGGAVVEREVFIPMIDDGSYGWNIVVSNELMQSILGGLVMPEV